MRLTTSAPLWVLLLAAAAAHSQTLPAGLELVQVATGLPGAVGVRHADDGSGRRFVIQRQGQIRIIDAAGALEETAFLDLVADPPALGFFNIGSPTGVDERGLLGLAFHPLYASNGRAFVYYLDGGSDTVVAEYQVSALDPDRLDPDSERVILRIYQPATNHNGGDIHFGPDGYLYVGMGDGGGSNDSACATGQALTPGATSCVISGANSFVAVPPAGVPRGNSDSRALLGKMLRIDVDVTEPPAPPPAGADLCGADSDSGVAAYAIPADNPFAGDAGGTAAACDEIYHYGLRNPFRWSFDRLTGDLIIGDVGQGAWEEVNLVGGAGGRNFGWNPCEGFHVRGSTSTLCSLAGSTDPILAYGRSLGFSISGGFRYRGPIAPIQGFLFFADYGGRLFVAEPASPRWNFITWIGPSAGNFSGFGEDEAGHLYVTRLSGTVSRINLPGPPPAALTVSKSAALTTDGGTPNVADRDDVVTYTVSVQNTGGQTVTDLVVSDSLGGGAPQSLNCAPTTLAADAVATCTAYTYTVTQDDIEAGVDLINVASATAEDPESAAVQDSDDAIVPVAAAAPQISVQKDATLSVDAGTLGAADVGDVISYNVSVNNSGNVRLTGLAVGDSFAGGAPQSLSCAPSTLEPQQVATCTGYQHVVTQADVDAGVTLVNLASAVATRVGGGAPIQGNDGASIPIAAAQPALVLNKQAALQDLDGDLEADVGETIAYLFEVQNTGNVTLNAVAVQDPRLGGTVACNATTLAPAQTTLCGPVDYTVVESDLDTAAILNIAVARGMPPAGGVIDSAPDSTSTPTDQGDIIFADGFED